VVVFYDEVVTEGEVAGDGEVLAEGLAYEINLAVGVVVEEVVFESVGVWGLVIVGVCGGVCYVYIEQCGLVGEINTH